MQGRRNEAHQNCTDKLAQQLSVRVFKCVRAGGPDDFDCTYAKGSAGHLVVAYATRTDVLVSCNKSKTAEWQVEAYYIMANYQEHAPVYGPVESVHCG